MTITLERKRLDNGIIRKVISHDEMGDSQILKMFIPRTAAKGNLRNILQEQSGDCHYSGPGQSFCNPPSVWRFRKAGLDGWMLYQFAGMDC